MADSKNGTGDMGDIYAFDQSTGMWEPIEDYVVVAWLVRDAY